LLSEARNEEDCRLAGNDEFLEEGLKPIKDYKIACILDEFSYECLKYEAVFIQLDPERWEITLSREQADLLFVESAWKGKDSKWREKLGNLLDGKDEIIKNIVKWCKVHNIPTVFWNKEDPPNFGYFIETAKLFDYVFSTDINCLPSYREILGHEKICPLLFAAQPRLHNPVNKNKDKLGQVAFAGTWYKYKYEDRKEYLETLLKPALAYDLHIYNRKPGDNDYEFPDIFEPFIKGSLTYEEMVLTYKKYDVFLNVNSVVNSPSMFSRRVFELLACGIPVLSNYSSGIERLFPGLVKFCQTREDTLLHLQELLGDKDYRDKLALAGQRKVLNYHTYQERMETVFNKTGLKYRKENQAGISVICCTNGSNKFKQIMDNFLRQKYLKKELIVLLSSNNLSHLEYWENQCRQHNNIQVYLKDEFSSGIEQVEYQYLANFDDGSYYAADFLVDLMHAFVYTDADIVGKCTYYTYISGSKNLALRNPGMENRYVKFLHSPTIVMKKEVFDRVNFNNKSWGRFLKKCKKIGFKLYSIDRFNYISAGHTPDYNYNWKINGIDYQKTVSYIDDPVKYVSA